MGKKGRGYIWPIIYLISIVTVVGCSGEDGTIGTGENPQTKVAGVAQKGPFLRGQTVTIYPLLSNGNIDLNVSPITGVTTNMGHFEFEGEIGRAYYITLFGLYYNEVLARQSTAGLRLNAIYVHSTTESPFVSVNVLTHIIHEKVLRLMSEGHDAKSAISIAELNMQDQISKFLRWQITPFSFNRATIYNTDATEFELGNALLLYLSAKFTQTAYYNSVTPNLTDLDYQLYKLVQNVSLQFANNSNQVVDFSLTPQPLDSPSVTVNLKNYALNNGSAYVDVPDISGFGG